MSYEAAGYCCRSNSRNHLQQSGVWHELFSGGLEKCDMGEGAIESELKKPFARAKKAAASVHTSLE
jgi:hypothetical protein